MLQEAVLETREGDRYIAFLIEEEEWMSVRTESEQDDVLIRRCFKWRVTDRLTGSNSEGVDPLQQDDRGSRVV